MAYDHHAKSIYVKSDRNCVTATYSTKNEPMKKADSDAAVVAIIELSAVKFYLLLKRDRESLDTH